MRCPSCSKFPAKDTDTEPEGDLDIDAEGMVTGDVRIVNTSECCGEELEETTFTVEVDFTEEVAAHMKEFHPKVKDTDLEIETDLSRTDESPSKDRNGKTITNPRYRKRFYGIVVGVTVLCNLHDHASPDRLIGAKDFADCVQASGMESLV